MGVGKVIEGTEANSLGCSAGLYAWLAAGSSAPEARPIRRRKEEEGRGRSGRRNEEGKGSHPAVTLVAAAGLYKRRSRRKSLASAFHVYFFWKNKLGKNISNRCKIFLQKKKKDAK